ncbi:MAG: hypothetical protein H7199_08930 [Burkholderiales bacterium]|nr:hypothetical protein [Flavobacterium sp.]
MKTEITITPIIDHESYDLNGHVIYIDSLGNWSCKADLTARQHQAFRNYEKLIIKNKRFKKHTKATYKG